MVKARFGDSINAMLKLSGRNLKLFFLDKVGVFFSVFAPMIVLLLYVLFLADLQVEVISAAIGDFTVKDGAIKAFADVWMLSGTIAVACFTVSLSANMTMVSDKGRGVVKDSLASPIKQWVLKLSYFISNYIITVSICVVVLVVGFIYIAIGGSWHLSVADVFAVFGNVLFSALASTLITVLLASFIKSASAMSAIIGICSAAIGFLFGAYMPLSTFPKGIQIFCGIIPGTHSAGIFRNIFMRGSLDNLCQGMPIAVRDGLSQAYGLEINFFGKDIGVEAMATVVAVAIVIFLVINIAVANIKPKRKVKLPGRIKKTPTVK